MKNKLRKLALILSFMVFAAGCGNSGQPQGEPENAATDQAADEGQETDDAKADDAEPTDDAEPADDAEAVTLNLAYQYGLAYAPLVIVQEQKLIENAYEEATGKKVTVTWNKWPDRSMGL